MHLINDNRVKGDRSSDHFAASQKTESMTRSPNKASSSKDASPNNLRLFPNLQIFQVCLQLRFRGFPLFLLFANRIVQLLPQHYNRLCCVLEIRLDCTCQLCFVLFQGLLDVLFCPGKDSMKPLKIKKVT